MPVLKQESAIPATLGKPARSKPANWA